MISDEHLNHVESLVRNVISNQVATWMIEEHKSFKMQCEHQKLEIEKLRGLLYKIVYLENGRFEDFMKFELGEDAWSEIVKEARGD